MSYQNQQGSAIGAATLGKRGVDEERGEGERERVEYTG